MLEGIHQSSVERQPDRQWAGNGSIALVRGDRSSTNELHERQKFVSRHDQRCHRRHHATEEAKRSGLRVSQVERHSADHEEQVHQRNELERLLGSQMRDHGELREGGQNELLHVVSQDAVRSEDVLVVVGRRIDGHRGQAPEDGDHYLHLQKKHWPGEVHERELQLVGERGQIVESV